MSGCPRGGGCTFHKPIILFYGFEGPFSCAIRTENPQNFICFPKTSKKQILWSGRIESDQIIIKDQSYPYLFWECKDYKLQGLKPHFRFSSQQIDDQVFRLLLKLGLNSTQATNFVTFWIQKWTKSHSWFVHVLAQQTIDKLFNLQITPEPDQIKRIFLVFGQDYGQQINFESLIDFQWKMEKKRTVVQWGATIAEFN